MRVGVIRCMLVLVLMVMGMAVPVRVGVRIRRAMAMRVFVIVTVGMLARMRMAMFCRFRFLLPEFFPRKFFLAGGNHIKLGGADAAAIDAGNFQPGVNAQGCNGPGKHFG